MGELHPEVVGYNPEMSRTEITQLGSSSQWTCGAQAEALAHPTYFLVLADCEQVGILLKREEELTGSLEEEAAARERERREYFHTARQARPLKPKGQSYP